LSHLKNNDEFYAWTDDSLAEGGIQISVNDNDIVEEDEGLYHVINSSSVIVLKD
jgi:hypothetical protein